LPSSGEDQALRRPPNVVDVVFVSNASKPVGRGNSMVANLRSESIPAFLTERRKIIDGGELRAVLQRREGPIEERAGVGVGVLM